MFGLDIEKEPLAGVPGLALAGELDVASVPDVERALDEAIRESTGAFVFDLCALDFMDSSGIRLLMRARSLLAREDRDLVVVCPPGPVRRAFKVAGISDLLALYPTREAAAADLTPVDS